MIVPPSCACRRGYKGITRHGRTLHDTPVRAVSPAHAHIRTRQHSPSAHCSSQHRSPSAQITAQPLHTTPRRQYNPMLRPRLAVRPNRCTAPHVTSRRQSESRRGSTLLVVKAHHFAPPQSSPSCQRTANSWHVTSRRHINTRRTEASLAVTSWHTSPPRAVDAVQDISRRQYAPTHPTSLLVVNACQSESVLAVRALHSTSRRLCITRHISSSSHIRTRHLTALLAVSPA